MIVGALLGCVHPPAPARQPVSTVVLVSRPSLGLLALANEGVGPPIDGVSVDALGVATWVRTPGGWRWPVEGVVTSGYGPRWGRLHGGIDLGAPVGTPVTAPRGGSVVRIGSSGDLGLSVELDHGDGWTSRYGHLSAIGVAVGDTLEATAVLGQVGATGNATGPHLHWEIRRDGKVVDPSCAVPQRAASSEASCLAGADGGS